MQKLQYIKYICFGFAAIGLMQQEDKRENVSFLPDLRFDEP